MLTFLFFGMYCNDLAAPEYFLFSSEVPALLYYSHFIAVISSLVMSFLVFSRGGYRSPASWLLGVSVVFSAWAVLDVITWVHIDARVIGLAWVFMNFLEPLIFAGMLFFVLSYLKGTHFRKWKLLAVSVLLLPFFVLMPTEFNITYFDITLCEAVEGPLVMYMYAFEVIMLAWIIFELVSYILHAHDSSRRRQLIVFLVGVLLFLVTFLAANASGSFTGDWNWQFYGLFGMPVFIGFLSYLIVRYKAFDIKLFETQVLVASLLILIASQFFFVRTFENIVLVGVTIVIAMFGGYTLIGTVQRDSQRTAELSILTNQLIKANERLKKLDEAKSEFISIASHQLRTPLTAVKGFISLVLEGSYGEVGPGVKNALNKVYLSNERLIQLVEDLLSISRIESGRMRYKLTEVDLNHLVREAYELFVIRARDKGLRFLYHQPNQLVQRIIADESKLREVLSNLVDNAIKYTESGTIDIYLEATSTHARIIVRDTGIGIDADEIQGLFSKFRRGKDTERFHANGTGLGLYVAKNLIESHKGRIWAQSEGREKGSVFIVELPFYADHSDLALDATTQDLSPEDRKINHLLQKH